MFTRAGQLTLLLALALLIGASGTSAQQKKKATTIHGELVELTSYIKEGIKPVTPAGKEIALENLKKGGSLAILEKGKNKLYLIFPAIGDTAFTTTVSPYLGVKTFIKGKVVTKSGVNAIVMEDIGKSLK